MNNDFIQFDVVDEHGPQTYRGTYEIAASEFESAEEISGPARVTIDVRADKGNSEGEYELQGEADFTIDLTCSRCVEPFPFANKSPFHVRFRPRPEPSGEENEEVEITNSEELDVEFYSERSIPLRDLAMEQIQLSLPMKPLCEESCLGLCPVCGKNRSREACSCGQAEADPRWEALKGIREQLNKKKDM